MSKIALINDSHFGIKNDSAFFLDKCLDYYSNEFFPFLEKNNISQIIHLGDFFDRRKYINFNTLREIRTRFLEKILPHQTFRIILGNHDTYYKNTNDVNSIRELFRGYPNIHIHDDPISIVVDGLDLSLIPWINDENSSKISSYIKTCNSNILMGHLEIMGFEVISGVRQYSGLDEKDLNKFEMVISGHFHMKQSRGNIHYLGTQYQTNFGDIGSPKGFHILDTETRELTFIENTDSFFNIIKYDDSFEPEKYIEQDLSKYENTFVKVLVRTKNKPFIFDKFMDRLYSIDTQEISVIDDYAEKPENPLIDISQDTLSLINKEIDDLQYDLNKDKLKLIVKDLYMEALSL